MNINAHFDIRDENKALNGGEGFPFLDDGRNALQTIRHEGNPLLFFPLRFAYTCARRFLCTIPSASFREPRQPGPLARRPLVLHHCSLLTDIRDSHGGRGAQLYANRRKIGVIALKKESGFQHDLIQTIRNRWPGSLVLKNDANYTQGIPDLLVLYEDQWAMLECKRSPNEAHQHNQDYYVSKLNGMAFARFIYPENAEEVLEELDRHFCGEDRLY